MAWEKVHLTKTGEKFLVHPVRGITGTTRIVSSFPDSVVITIPRQLDFHFILKSLSQEETNKSTNPHTCILSSSSFFNSSDFLFSSSGFSWASAAVSSCPVSPAGVVEKSTVARAAEAEGGTQEEAEASRLDRNRRKEGLKSTCFSPTWTVWRKEKEHIFGGEIRCYTEILNIKTYYNFNYFLLKTSSFICTIFL